MVRLFRKTSGWFAILVLVTIGLHANTRSDELVHDDHEIVAPLQGEELTIGALVPWKRPVRTLSLAVDEALFGDRFALHHLQSIALHFANVSLIFGLLVRWTRSHEIAVATALLFTVHPVHVEAVANLANRKELLALFFSLVCVHFYLCASTAGSRGKCIASLLAGFVAWALAVGSKEVAVVLPLSLFAYERARWVRGRRLLSRRFVVLGFGAATLVAVAVFAPDWVEAARARTFAGYRGDPTPFSTIATSIRSFGEAMGLLVWPSGLSPDHRVELVRTAADPELWMGLSALVGLVVTIVAAARCRRSRMLAFALAWVFVHWIPVSNLLPVSYFLAERYLYVPSAGFCLAVAWGWARVRHIAARLDGGARWTGAATFAGAAVVVSLGVATLRYNAIWSSERSLWSHAVRQSPHSFKAHNNLGVVYLEDGRADEAISCFDRALALRPGYVAARHNRALARQSLGLGTLTDRSANLEPNKESLQ